MYHFRLILLHVSIKSISKNVDSYLQNLFAPLNQCVCVCRKSHYPYYDEREILYPSLDASARFNVNAAKDN